MSSRDEPLADLIWPASRLGEAIEILARQGKLLVDASPTLPAIPDLSTSDDETVGKWIDNIAFHLDLEAEATVAGYGEIDQFIRGAYPALMRLPDEEGQHQLQFLVVLKANWRHVFLIGPDHSTYPVDPQHIRNTLCSPIEAPFLSHINDILNKLEITGQRPSRNRLTLTREIIMQAGLATTTVGAGWLLRPLPNTSLRGQARYKRLSSYLFSSLGLILVWQLLQFSSWLLIGRGALQGRFDWAWFLAWVLVMCTIAGIQWFTFNFQGNLFIKVGQLFKSVFLYGATQLEIDEIRYQGSGQFLAREMQASQLESVALIRGMNVVIYLFMILTSGIFLAMGAGGLMHVGLMLGWMTLLGYISWRCLSLGQSWMQSYRQMTNDLVERMIGHRTRLVQENPDNWHTQEDQLLQDYLRITERINRIEVWVEAFIPNGWLVVGLIGITQSLATASAPPAQLALSIGGILLIYQALTSLTRKFSDFLTAFLSWDQIQPLLQAARRSVDDQFLEVVSDDEQTLIKAVNLGFRYPSRTTPVLQQCSLQIEQGDRLLLEGPSGGGKSTLAALLSGLYPPDTGMLLLWGFDPRTLGLKAWRRRVVSVPQFQENHIITESFAFNLLMGHRWPPLPEDLVEAEAVCRELGLGPLLDRMPEGFDQRVGDSGWRLSHGESSRLFIARALLQKPDLIILDESFGALDPENLERTMQCVLNRASTLLVIAHP